jgi:hypothetical protein
MKSKPTQPAPLTQSSARSPRMWIIWVLISIGIITLATLRDRMSSRAPTTSEAVATSDQTNAPSAPPVPANADFQKLLGKWLRPDGGYVLELKSDQPGKLTAAYFNPRPINVAKAEATQEGSATKVFVELRDVNYPGSTYTLTYLKEKDLLVGVYYQALQQQSFEVYFERMK